MTRNRLYLLLTFGLLAGYSLLAWSLWPHGGNEGTVCFFKNATGIPCPSCGSTRSVLAIARGQLADAAFLNPLGFIIAALLALLPLWLLYDIVLAKDTLHKGYARFETALRIKWVAIALGLLVLANWAWNIYKGL